MKLTSHGCSFVYGSELSSPSLSWPSLIAKRLHFDYDCFAVPGSGNLQIMESIMLNADKTDICIINWTWLDRFDWIDTYDESWQTFRPALDHDHAEFYYRNLHSQYRDMLTNLVYISASIEFLSQKQIPFIMTYMDHVMFDSVHPRWHQPGAVSYLQHQVRPHLHDFDGLNFLDWSRNKGFGISGNWHPSAQAHAAAAELMQPVIDAILRRA